MNLDYLRYFVKLAEVRHYTKAAEQLCISQPSLSHAIRQLEEELGVPLFEKTGRNTALTQFGEKFLDCARRTLLTLDGGVEALRRSARGEGLIRLGFLRVLGIHYIPRMAAEFLSANPDKNIRFSFHSGRTSELLDGLESQKFDLIFCSRPFGRPHLSAFPVRQQDLVLIVPRDHPLADRRRIGLEETVSYPMVCFSEGSGLRKVIDGLFEQIGAAPPVACETEEDQVIAGLVARGFGIAVVPYMDLLLKLDLSILEIQSPAYRWDFFMVRDSRAYLTPAAQNFQRFILDRTPGV